MDLGDTVKILFYTLILLYMQALVTFEKLTNRTTI